MKVFGYNVTGSKRAVLDVMNINDKGYELNFESSNLQSRFEALAFATVALGAMPKVMDIPLY